MRNFEIKTNESGRSFLPICEVDAPLFLSAVYNKRYTSEKTTSRCPQSGRSMIEMLGVLAIIGVLSVGGIAGYSKAMMKYRINKTIEQITLIAGNVRAFWGPQKNYDGVRCHYYNEEYHSDEGNGDCPIAKKAKIFPEEMLTLDSDGKITKIENAFGGFVSINYYDKSSSSDKRAFYIQYSDIPQEACIELLTQDWTNANILGVALNGGTPRGLTPVDVDRATNACYSGNGNIEILFYGDIDPAYFVKDLPSHYQL